MKVCEREREVALVGMRDGGYYDYYHSLDCPLSTAVVLLLSTVSAYNVCNMPLGLFLEPFEAPLINHAIAPTAQSTVILIGQ